MSKHWRRPSDRPLWPLVALALVGLLILILSLVLPAALQAQGEDPEDLCVSPVALHQSWGRIAALRDRLDSIPECSSACAELEALAGRIEAGVAWAILPDGTAQRHQEGRYRFASRRDWERLETLRARCRQDIEAGCRYVPGLPSTGQTPVELESGGGR